MMINSSQSRTVALAIFLFVVLMYRSDTANCQLTDLGVFVGEYHRLLEAARTSGKDVTKAEQLNEQSKLAMSQGRSEEAKDLLEKAIALLNDRTFTPPSYPQKDIPIVAPLPVTALPQAPTDPIGRNSPFAIFGPYQFKLDQPTKMTYEQINSYLEDLGVAWVQEMPMEISRIPANINIYSRVGREGGALPPHIDYTTYLPALRQTISQCKGRVKYWEVDTEPGGLPPPMGWQGFAAEYVDFLQKTSATIKDVCPDCQVALGGMGGIAEGPEEDGNAAFLRAILKLGAASSFDIFSFKLHHYKASDYVAIKRKLLLYNQIFAANGIALTTKNIFLETASYDGIAKYPVGHPLAFIDLPAQSEAQQAINLVKTHIFALAQGVHRIFWNEVFERANFGGEQNNPFNSYGLVNNPDNPDRQSHKKLAYYTYQKMIETLEGSDWQTLTTIREDNGVYIYTVQRHGRTIAIAWTDRQTPVTVTIPGMPSGSLYLTPAVPAAVSGRDLGDVPPSFPRQNRPSHQIVLTDIPLYIEAAN